MLDPIDIPPPVFFTAIEAESSEAAAGLQVNHGPRGPNSGRRAHVAAMRMRLIFASLDHAGGAGLPGPGGPFAVGRGRPADRPAAGARDGRAPPGGESWSMQQMWTVLQQVGPDHLGLQVVADRLRRDHKLGDTITVRQQPEPLRCARVCVRALMMMMMMISVCLTHNGRVRTEMRERRRTLWRANDGRATVAARFCLVRSRLCGSTMSRAFGGRRPS